MANTTQRAVGGDQLSSEPLQCGPLSVCPLHDLDDGTCGVRRTGDLCAPWLILGLSVEADATGAQRGDGIGQIRHIEVEIEAAGMAGGVRRRMQGENRSARPELNEARTLVRDLQTESVPVKAHALRKVPDEQGDVGQVHRQAPS